MCFPREYGGLGLTPAHQMALREELSGFAYPFRLQAPTFSPCAAVLLEFGTHEQKLRHLPAIIKGEELWMQLLSEPSGGSDVAAALMTAVRDGDEWILNGSKVWTTGAWFSDWGLCLARTNWDVPKHRGLSVFIFPLHQPGIEIHRIEMLNGFKDFCQEFITDVRVPDSARIGDVNEGWTIGTRWMFHERMLHNSPYVTSATGNAGSARREPAQRRHRPRQRPHRRPDEPRPARRGVHARARRRGDPAPDRRGHLDRHDVGPGRIGRPAVRRRLDDRALTSIAFELAGSSATAWDDTDGAAAEIGNDYLLRQVSTLGGGTTEMARNVISERVLGMPRELSYDRNTPFRDVPKGPPSK